MKTYLFSVLLVGTVVANASWANEVVITVQYRDKPPYSYTKDGMPAGFLIERTAEVFKLANVEAKFVEVPVKRITRDIRYNASSICSPTWYKLTERMAYARFSLPIHEDRPHLVLAGVHAQDQIRSIKSLKALLAHPTLRLGTVAGTSYGVELDAMISATEQTVMETTVSPLGMAKMIQRKRADYMFIDEEDYRYLREQNQVDATDGKPMRFADMPSGLQRYIMCSKRVSPDTMARLNEAIRQVVPAQRQLER